IDNDDTKDMDDAVSLDTDADGNYVLGVHIADVSHYVRPGSALDAEALLRGTSVYLADRVIPMLPQALSNGICSLNENEDRLTVSCVMTIDRAGKVVSHEIFPSVIKVAKRLTYSAANAMLAGESLESDGNNEVNRANNTAICGLLTRLAALSETLLQKRLSRGAVVLDIPETKVTVDGDGAPVDIGPYQHGPASGIIEECMLACNETVAEEYSRLGLTFAYRCHEEPDAENMTRLKLFAKSFGYDLKLHAFREREGRADKKHGPRKKKPQSLSKALQGLLSQIAGTPEEAVIGKAILRSFKQARYHPENLGHFGLAARYYCHFTSPIRRYPDLIVHRVINEHLRGMSAPEQDRLEKSMPSVCGRSSSAERRAEELEREVDNLKKAQYMSKRIGQVYDGIISGVSGRGLYVALPNTVEGSVSMRDLYGDYFIFDERRMALVGERFGKVYRPGQTVRVKVTGADPESRSVSFKIE
ncbi:MAG: VacB/RNase II family 3'-5' exoribonuclease, partial [Defluviitaleaceae bacterium]|nr:VacB/RNase II family 3'-5' exoribonuclease [Defluviitaleaceae bacterium]